LLRICESTSVLACVFCDRLAIADPTLLRLLAID
jgi:hypothetical protein